MRHYIELGPFLGSVRVYAWAVFLVFWARMGWTDWFHQKIRNRQVLLLLALSLAGWAALGAHTAAGIFGHARMYLIGAYYARAALYILFSLAAAYALWALRIWPAGDVKLYAALAALFPLLAPAADLRSELRFLEVLINTFLPAAAALFVLSSDYVVRTRFAHHKEFLARLGLRRGFDFMLEKSAETAGKAFRQAREQLGAVRREPRAFLVAAAEWLLTMALMSVVSYWLRDVVRSALAKSVLFFGLFFLWGRLHGVIGRAGSLLLAGSAVGALYWRGGTEWSVLLEHMGRLSAFSLSITLGMAWAVQLLAGEIALFVYPVMTLAAALLVSLGRAFTAGLAHALAWIPLDWAIWFGMGLFFGLSLVFVRIWDRESFESVAPEQVRPFMTLGPTLLERIAQEEEFFAEHFGDLYADGLTPDQVSALRDWCVRSGVGAVPLAPTISFCSWLFLGYFLTWLLDGNVLALLLRR